MDNFRYDPSLVLYLPLSKLDGDVISDRSAYGHLCTVTGALWGLNGRVFDGDDRLDLASNYASLKLIDTSWTEIVWFKSTVAGVGNQYILNKFTGSDRQRTLYLTADGFLFSRVSLDGTTFEIEADVIDSVDYRDSTWHMAALRHEYDTGDRYLMADGLVVDSAIAGLADDTTVNDSGEIVRIGVDDNGGSPRFYMIGTIGEVRIYSRALSALEVQHIYLATKWRYR